MVKAFIWLCFGVWMNAFSGPHHQRSWDDSGIQTQEGWEWYHQILVTYFEKIDVSTQQNALFLHQISPKTARALVLPATRRCQPKKRRANDPNHPAKKKQSPWNPSERPLEAKRSAELTTFYHFSFLQFISGEIKAVFRVTGHSNRPPPSPYLPQESRHDKDKSEKKEKRDSSGGKEEKKQYP